MAPALELLETTIPSLPTKTVPYIHNGATPSNELGLQSEEKHKRVMSVFRAFIADLCQQFGEGHAGYLAFFSW